MKSFFIRLAGCNLRCWFCDTPYASWRVEGALHTLETIVERAVASGCTHAVLTGGEPLLPARVGELTSALRREGLHLTIETAGTIDREIECDLLSLSPKLAGSTPRADKLAVQPSQANNPEASERRWRGQHERRRWRPEVVARLIERSDDYQAKFVVDSPADCQATLAAIQALRLPADHVWIMPQALRPEELEPQAAWLRPWCQRHRFHYCDRMQLRWYGAKRAT
ncbi:MAG: 7-carboxy-7-deazaguanine synthase QueE [Pirellulaceae bacterium]